MEFKNIKSINELIKVATEDFSVDFYKNKNDLSYESYEDEGHYSYFVFPKIGYAIVDCMESGTWEITPLDETGTLPLGINYSDQFEKTNKIIPDEAMKAFIQKLDDGDGNLNNTMYDPTDKSWEV